MSESMACGRIMLQEVWYCRNYGHRDARHASICEAALCSCRCPNALHTSTAERFCVCVCVCVYLDWESFKLSGVIWSQRFCNLEFSFVVCLCTVIHNDKLHNRAFRLVGSSTVLTYFVRSEKIKRGVFFYLCVPLPDWWKPECGAARDCRR
jgi:hypothetical protein